MRYRYGLSVTSYKTFTLVLYALCVGKIAQESKKITSLTELEDLELAATLQDSLVHDTRTSHLTLSITVDGRVAHVAGTVQSEEERQLVRKLLRRQNGLYAVWDLLRLDREVLSIIDIGCGDRKQIPQAIGVDKREGPEVDIVTNLENALPFQDNSTDHLFAVHVLEHVHNLIGLMNDIHRVLRPSGVLHVLVPHWKDVIAVADPTHVRFFDIPTFQYFCESKPGIKQWKPLMLSASKDTVFADLIPLKK